MRARRAVQVIEVFLVGLGEREGGEEEEVGARLVKGERFTKGDH